MCIPLMIIVGSIAFFVGVIVGFESRAGGR